LRKWNLKAETPYMFANFGGLSCFHNVELVLRDDSVVI
jgi:hypothetical protein